MSAFAGKQALFSGLVFNEQGEPAEVTRVGGEPFYVILDKGFRRHVEAEVVDRQVLEWLQEQVVANRELVTEGVLQLLGEQDLFAKAKIDASINDLDHQLEQLMVQGLPEEAITWLGVLGFRIVVDLRGQVLSLEAPGAVDGQEW